MKGDAPKNPFLFDRQVNVIIGSFFYCCSSYFFRGNRRSLPRLPLHLVLYSQLVEYFRYGSSSSDVLSDSAALQTKEEVACKLLAGKAAMFVINHSRPQCLRFWLLSVMRKGALG